MFLHTYIYVCVKQFLCLIVALCFSLYSFRNQVNLTNAELLVPEDQVFVGEARLENDIEPHTCTTEDSDSETELDELFSIIWNISLCAQQFQYPKGNFYIMQSSFIFQKTFCFDS